MPKAVSKKPRSITVTVDGEEFEADEIDIPDDLTEQLRLLRIRISRNEQAIAELQMLMFPSHL
jgi:hypothetical protein